MAKLRLVHVITGLSTGGAELTQLRLAECLSSEFDQQVISLTSGGSVVETLAAAGVEVVSLGMRRGIPDPGGIWRLAGMLRTRKPALVQSWMYHADLVAGLAALLGHRPPVVWNVRNASLHPSAVRRGTAWTARVSAKLGRALPTRIVCCSNTARDVHVGIGYPPERMVVIPNGFDVTRFRPDPEERERFRMELGIPIGAPTVGCVGRFDPVKDHYGFLQSAARLAKRHPEARFVLCGAGVEPSNVEIMGWVRELGLEDRCMLLGQRTDLEYVYRALDLLVLPSYTEAFPNVVGEAMASGVPCVVTAVGDAPLIVGDTGRVVPPRDTEALAAAIGDLIGLTPDAREVLGARARVRIQEHFGLAAMVARYEELYRELTCGVWNRRDH